MESDDVADDAAAEEEDGAELSAVAKSEVDEEAGNVPLLLELWSPPPPPRSPSALTFSSANGCDGENEDDEVVPLEVLADGPSLCLSAAAPFLPPPSFLGALGFFSFLTLALNSVMTTVTSLTVTL